MTAPIVIVGAGQAAASFISRHVALANPQPVVLIGEEYWRRAVDIDFLAAEGVMDELVRLEGK